MKQFGTLATSFILLASSAYAEDMTKIRKDTLASLQGAHVSSTVSLTGLKTATDKAITALAEAKARGDAVEELNIRKMLKDQQGDAEALTKYIATMQAEIAASLK